MRRPCLFKQQDVTPAVRAVAAPAEFVEIVPAIFTTKQAATYCGCSPRTFADHVSKGRVKYINIGHGIERRRLRFKREDLDAFLNASARKAPGCLSGNPVNRHSIISSSSSPVIDFTVRRKRRTGVKPSR